MRIHSLVFSKSCVFQGDPISVYILCVQVSYITLKSAKLGGNSLLIGRHPSCR